jgi:protein arginine kinase activator
VSAAPRRRDSKKQQFDIAELLVKMVDDSTSTEEERVGHVQCPRCGLLYSGFRETGRLGCAECYTAFQFQLRPLLRRIHGDTRHRGKRPFGEGEGATRFRQIQRMHEREEFERAATLRDEIRRLEEDSRAGTEGKT